MISLNSVRPFCWFHTYYLITTRFRINNAKISRVIILLSNRTLSALKCPVYKGFQKIFITQTQFWQLYIVSIRVLYYYILYNHSWYSMYSSSFYDFLQAFCNRNHFESLFRYFSMYSRYPSSKIWNAQLLSVKICLRFVVTISYILLAFFWILSALFMQNWYSLFNNSLYFSSHLPA